MGYLCAALWFLAGLVLIIRMGKENRVFYLLGGYFLFLSAWWAAGAATGINLFSGVWGVVLRVVTAAALAAACVAFVRQNRRDRSERSDGSGK